GGGRPSSGAPCGPPATPPGGPWSSPRPPPAAPRRQPRARDDFGACPRRGDLLFAIRETGILRLALFPDRPQPCLRRRRTRPAPFSDEARPPAADLRRLGPPAVCSCCRADLPRRDRTPPTLRRHARGPGAPEPDWTYLISAC